MQDTAISILRGMYLFLDRLFYFEYLAKKLELFIQVVESGCGTES